jgi:hypothetical protein
MPNKALLNKKLILPDTLVNNIISNPDNFSTQMKNFAENGYMSYDDIKNFIRRYPQMNEEEKIKHGGANFYKFVTKRYTKMKDAIEKSKDIKQDAGFENSHIKTHEKNFSDTGKGKSINLEVNENIYKKIINLF